MAEPSHQVSYLDASGNEIKILVHFTTKIGEVNVAYRAEKNTPQDLSEEVRRKTFKEYSIISVNKKKFELNLKDKSIEYLDGIIYELIVNHLASESQASPLQYFRVVATLGEPLNSSLQLVLNHVGKGVKTSDQKEFYKDAALNDIKMRLKQQLKSYYEQRKKLETKCDLLGDAEFPLDSSGTIEMALGRRFTCGESPVSRNITTKSRKLESIRHYYRLDQVTNKSIVAIHVQSRGFGKTKEAWDLALSDSRHVFFFDVTQVEDDYAYCEVGAKTSLGRAYYQRVSEACTQFAAGSEELCREARAATKYLFITAVVHAKMLSDAQYEIDGQVIPPHVLLHLTINGQDLRDEVYAQMVKIDIASISDDFLRDTLTSFKEPIIIVDEAQELMNVHQIPKIFKHRQQKTDLATLYHQFTQSLINFLPGKVTKLLTGTELTITKIIKGENSPFKSEEIAYLTPLSGFSVPEVQSVLRCYFPGLEIPDGDLGRWNYARPRTLFEFLIASMLAAVQKKKVSTRQELKEWFIDNQHIMFQRGVDYIYKYIELACERHGHQVANNDEIFRKVVWKILCCSMFSDEHISLEPIELTDVLNSGFISLGETIHGGGELRINKVEPMAHLALVRYFSGPGKQIAMNDFQSRFKGVRIDKSGVGYVFEKYFVYLLISRFLNNKQPLSHAAPFSACEEDDMVDYYVFEATRFVSLKTKLGIDEILKPFLEDKMTHIVVQPPSYCSRGDYLFFLRRMSGAEYVNAIADKRIRAREDFNKLPQHRLVMCQVSVGEKKENDLQNVWLSAIQTVNGYIEKENILHRMQQLDSDTEDGIHCFSNDHIKQIFRDAKQRDANTFLGMISMIISRNHVSPSEKYLVPSRHYKPNGYRCLRILTTQDMVNDNDMYNSMGLKNASQPVQYEYLEPTEEEKQEEQDQMTDLQASRNQQIRKRRRFI
ncbi:ADP-ribosylation factor-like protein [Acrasis kona]|uniref:ADP-ribosylation factor-like protein n=1 Tax=Acrasis kona TaxID=1008807 RepID=A0AAW2ZLQ2_9EUKA